MLKKLKQIRFPKYTKKVIIAIAGLFLFYFSCIHYTDYHEIAIIRNDITGNTYIDSVSGFGVTAPWTQVAKVDTRPIRVCITSSTRNFNCRLVYFDKRYWQEFVSLEGFKYYWWANRFSFNFGYDDEYRGMKDIMRGYAFDSHPHKFIKIIDVEQ